MLKNAYVENACETIFWKVIPAIRRELAVALTRKGIKKKEVANLLGITPAALSQYLTGKRGKTELPKWAVEKIREYARIHECYDICEICMEIRRDPRFEEIVPNARRCVHA